VFVCTKQGIPRKAGGPPSEQSRKKMGRNREVKSLKENYQSRSQGTKGKLPQEKKIKNCKQDHVGDKGKKRKKKYLGNMITQRKILAWSGKTANKKKRKKGRFP